MISVNFMFFFILVKFRVCLSESDCLFLSFAHFVETDCKKWSSWNSFIRIKTSFFIIMYDSHVLHLYFSHLIRSLNHADFMFHFMSSIKSTKYRCGEKTHLYWRFLRNFLCILHVKSAVYVCFLQTKYYFRITLFLEWFYLAVFMIYVFVIYMLESNYWFSSFTHSVKTDYEKWSW